MNIKFHLLILNTSLNFNQFSPGRIPRPNEHPHRPDGFYVPHLETNSHDRELHHDSVSHFEHPIIKTEEAKFELLSNAFGDRAIRSYPLVTDLLDPVKNHRLSQHTKDILTKSNGGGILHFKVLKISYHGKTFNALKIIENNRDHSAEAAYWLPQKGHVDIPLKPTINEPRFVLTPGFNGCSLTADLVNSHTIRLYHVNGGTEEAEYNRKNHFLGMIGALVYKNYGYHMDKGKIIEHKDASVFVQFMGVHWMVRYQMIENIPHVLKAISDTKLEFSFPESTKMVGFDGFELRVPR